MIKPWFETTLWMKSYTRILSKKGDKPVDTQWFFLFAPVYYQLWEAFRKKMTDLNTMMWEQGLPYAAWPASGAKAMSDYSFSALVFFGGMWKLRFPAGSVTLQQGSNVLPRCLMFDVWCLVKFHTGIVVLLETPHVLGSIWSIAILGCYGASLKIWRGEHGLKIWRKQFWTWESARCHNKKQHLIQVLRSKATQQFLGVSNKDRYGQDNRPTLSM